MSEIIIALSNPVEGRADEFRDWYWNTHIAEVLALPGFRSAKVYELAGAPDPAAPHRFATIYEIDGSASEARTRLFTSGLGVSDAMLLEGGVTAAYEARLIQQ